MSGVYKVFEFLWSAITVCRSVRQHAVITPIPSPGKATKGQEFDGCDPKRHKVVQLSFDAPKSPLGRKSPDMKFVDDRFLPWTAAPVVVFPGESGWIDYLTRPMYS